MQGRCSCATFVLLLCHIHVGYPGAVVLAPATVICITVVVLGGGAIFALSCCGARTFVRFFNPHGQSVIVKMHNGVRIAIVLFKQITACVDCAFYGLFAMLAGCTYYAPLVH